MKKTLRLEVSRDVIDAKVGSKLPTTGADLVYLNCEEENEMSSPKRKEGSEADNSLFQEDHATAR